MKKFILVFSLLIVGMASFADSWFTIHKVEYRKWSMDKESTCIFITTLNTSFVTNFPDFGTVQKTF